MIEKRKQREGQEGRQGASDCAVVASALLVKGWDMWSDPSMGCKWCRGQARGLPGDPSLIQCLTHRDGK